MDARSAEAGMPLMSYGRGLKEYMDSCISSSSFLKYTTNLLGLLVFLRSLKRYFLFVERYHSFRMMVRSASESSWMNAVNGGGGCAAIFKRTGGGLPSKRRPVKE